MLDEFTHLFERPFVKQKVQTLAGGKLAFGVLPGSALFAASGFSQSASPTKLFEFFFKIHLLKPMSKRR
jgi:hypothetical protein